MFTFIRYIATLMAAFALITGTATSASAATTADFSAAWSQNVEANAEAMGVALAGADAKGKILLEEEKTRSPHKAIRNFKPPTYAQVKKFGTIVPGTGPASVANGQAILTKEVKVYDKIVTDARVKVAKLKLRIKHADSPAEKAELVKKLKKAKKWLHRVKTSWKFKPILRLLKGTCGVNSGRTDKLELQPFTFCVGARNDTVEVAMAWIPQIREVVIAVIVHADGTVEVGCFNIGGFDAPPGTPDESMFIVVKALAQVQLTVTVGVRVVGDLTVTGVMKQDGVQCDQDSKTQYVNELKQLEPITVTATDTDKALAFGREKVQANAEARAEVKQSVAANLTQSIKLSIQLSCESPPQVNQPPTGEIVQWPAHQDQNEYYRIKYVGSSVEHGGNVVNECTVTGGASRVSNDPNHPTIEDIEGNQKVTTFWVKSHASADVEVQLECQTTDPENLKSVIYTKTWMVVAMPV